MGFYLLDHPPARRQFYPSRANPPTGAVGVHTTEGALDRIAPDTGAENVAAFISRRTDPGSYSEIVDTDSVVQMVPDDYTTFSVSESGYNSRTWNIALACRADELDPDDDVTRSLVARLGERIRGYWLRNGYDPRECARWVGTGALTRAGLFNHGDVQPQDRSDAWARHPRRAELDRMLVDAIVGAPVPNPPEEDDMAGTWHRWVHEGAGAQYAVLEQGSVYVGKVWLHPDHVSLYTSGAMGPFDGSDDFASNAPRLDALPWLGTPPLADLSDSELLAEIRKLPDDTVAALKAAL